MKNKGFKYILIATLLIISMLIPSGAAKANTTKNIKVDAFIKLLVNSLEIKVDKTVDQPYIDAALKLGIVKENDFKNYDQYITRTDVAVLLNRADEYLHGDTVDEKLLNTVLEKRISDITKITKSKREAVAKIVAKGIIKGYSNGYYIQNREFRGSNYITSSGAKNVINLVTNPTNRAEISPDGQLIRSTNLPKNYKDFDYILECFPNSFYEQKFRYQTTKYYYKPKELVDYASAKKIKEMKNIYPMIEKYSDIWMDKIETNLRLRLNVDYCTVNDDWVNDLAQTYWYSEFNMDIRKQNVDYIKKYIKAMKKNKVIIQSDIIAVEPSTISYSNGIYVRVYVKFKVQANSLKDLSNVFYGNSEFVNLKNNVWHEGIYEIRLGTKNGSSDGFDFAVTNDSLNDYRFNVIYKE